MNELMGAARDTWEELTHARNALVRVLDIVHLEDEDLAALYHAMSDIEELRERLREKHEARQR